MPGGKLTFVITAETRRGKCDFVLRAVKSRRLDLVCLSLSLSLGRGRWRETRTRVTGIEKFQGTRTLAREHNYEAGIPRVSCNLSVSGRPDNCH